jgi:muramidase (phage lysozyme)
MSNRQAFLDMIAKSEIGACLLEISDNGYNVLVGSTPKQPCLFKGYADHPRVLVRLSSTLSSTAAGRYQILARYFDAYKRILKLPDFSPASQDAIAMQMIKERGALPDIDAGRFSAAVNKVSNIWASLPGPGNVYGQHVNNIDHLQSAYIESGGTLA